MQDKVGSRTLEGRRLRRHVLKGAVIVFITAGYSGKKFIFEKVIVGAHQRLGGTDYIDLILWKKQACLCAALTVNICASPSVHVSANSPQSVGTRTRDCANYVLAGTNKDSYAGWDVHCSRLAHISLASCLDAMYMPTLASDLPAMQAKELGVRTIIIDGPDSWCQTLQEEKLAEKFVSIDFSDAETVFDRCLAAVKKIKKAGVDCTQHLLKRRWLYTMASVQTSLLLFSCVLVAGQFLFCLHWQHTVVQQCLQMAAKL